MTHSVPYEVRLARAALTWLADPGDAWLGALVADFGPEATLEAIRSGRLPAVTLPGRTPGLREALARWRSGLPGVPSPGDIAGLLGGGIRLVCPGDGEWPPRL